MAQTNEQRTNKEKALISEAADSLEFMQAGQELTGELIRIAVAELEENGLNRCRDAEEWKAEAQRVIANVSALVAVVYERHATERKALGSVITQLCA